VVPVEILTAQPVVLGDLSSFGDTHVDINSLTAHSAPTRAGILAFVIRQLAHVRFAKDCIGFCDQLSYQQVRERQSRLTDSTGLPELGDDECVLLDGHT
jgi:hypothetical protein